MTDKIQSEMVGIVKNHTPKGDTTMKQKMQFTTSRTERLSVGLYAFGTILSYYMIMSYLQLYMTDIGISAVAVGIIFMFAKVY